MAGRGCGSKNKWPAGWARARLLCRSARNNRGRRASVLPAADTQQTHSGEHDIPQSSASTCLFPPRSPGTGSSDPAPSSGESANFRSLSGSVGELRVLALSTTRPPHSRADTDRRRLGRGSGGGPNRRSRLQGSAPHADPLTEPLDGQRLAQVFRQQLLAPDHSSLTDNSQPGPTH